MRVLFLALIFACPLPAAAAELTRVASSFDPDRPFGMYLDLGFERTATKEKIVHLSHQSGGLQDVNELWYQMTDSRLKIDAHIGLWQDLEFHFGLPIVFAQDRSWGFTSDSNPTTSTITNNCLQANGQLLDPACPTSLAGAQAMFQVPASSNRGGLGDMTFGLAYALFNTKRDDTKPMWVIGMDYTAPTASLLDPTVPTSSSNRGNIGEKLHKYQFYTALSRRTGAIDPYFKIHYTLPFAGPGWYSNCDHPSALNMGAPENCNSSAWSRADTGIKPSHTGGVIFGAELNAFEDAAKHQKVAIDIRGIATYISEGRYYNEMSDLFGKLLYSQEYMQFGGQIGLVAQPADFIALKLNASLIYNTDHMLTYENIGKDLNGDGTVDVSDPAQHLELNPNFDWRTDMTGRGFRATDSLTFVLNATASFHF